jgi:3-methyladenine DNA glycosylase AlkD
VTTATAIAAAVRDALVAVADPAKAGDMQAYMRSSMPFLGVQKPARTAALQPVLSAYRPQSRPGWERDVRAVWDTAEFREQRYAAIALSGVRPARDWQDVDTLVLYQHLISSGSWWDLVDEVATRRVGPILRADREAVAPVVRTWASDDDRWLRRTAIICQVAGRGDVDQELLRQVIELNTGDRDFFIRKAIGWALRDHARHNPDWVRALLDELGDRLAPLSRREAAKHL